MNVQMKTLPSVLVRDQTNWKDLYQEHMPRIYNYFRYRIGDNMLSEDLTAKTFEKAWRARKSYQNKQAAFTTWLYTIAKNVLADHFRTTHDEQSIELAAEIPSVEENPEQSIITKQGVEQLISALAAFSIRERDLIALKYGAGLNNREISRLSGISESNVGTIIHRTVSKLRKALEQTHE